MRFLILFLFLGLGTILNAQEITVDEVTYVVKKDVIYKNGVDVTNTLNAEEKAKILAAFEKKKLELARQEEAQRKLEKAEKEQKKAEKEQKKAEKKQRKAEKALKQKEKAQANFDKAVKKHKDAQKKYGKLKSKGKLSPVDEKKWLEKIEKLNNNIAKAKKKLK